MMERAAVDIRLSSPVEKIVRDESGISGVQTSTSFIPSRHVILATGGSSYPRTGTTGDGFQWGQDLGHTVIPIRSALAPIYLDPVPPPQWQGVPIRNCILKARSAGKTVAEWRGDVLITHQGISGPATLEISRDSYLAWEKNRDVTIYIDSVPEESETQFEKHLQQEIVSNGTRNVETLIELFLPTRLAPFILQAVHIDGSKKCHQLQKEERQAIVRMLKNWNIGRVEKIPLERGEVTAGGIDLHEVDPASMSSRLVKGLFLCGEVLDIAGPIGGYNLQAAFSTGYVAGETAARDYKAEKSVNRVMP
jgi:predicted Rossmann fold flavoprotein